MPNLIQRMGFVTWLSITVSTTVLLLTLSVFNGLTDLIRTLFVSFNPDIRIEHLHDHFFSPPTHLKDMPGVASVTEVIDIKSLVRYQDRQVVVPSIHYKCSIPTKHLLLLLHTVVNISSQELFFP